MNALEDSANTDRCTLYEDSANLLKDERFTKTEYQTSHETPRELGRQSETKREQALQSEVNVCRRRRKCNLKMTSLTRSNRSFEECVRYVCKAYR